MSIRLAMRVLSSAALASLLLSAPALAADVIVAWDVPASGAPAGYQLFYGSTPGSGSISLHTPGTLTTAILRGLEPGRTYHVRVHAHDALGGLGPASNEIAIAVPADALLTPLAPAAPPPGTEPGDASYLPTSERVRFPMLRQDGDAHSHIALANPLDSPAAVTLVVTPDEGAPVIRTLSVPALAQRVVALESLMPQRWGRFDVAVLASGPIGAQRREVWGGAFAGHADAGVAAPRTSWVFADGSTRAPLRTSFAVYNPSEKDAELSFLYLRASAAAVTRVHVVPARGREVIEMGLEGLELEKTDAGVQITSSNGVAVYVERTVALVGADGLTRGGHGSSGVEAPRLAWSFADGATGPYFDLQLALVNLSTSTAQLAIDVRRSDGVTVTRSVIVPAKRRITLLLDTLDTRLANAAVSVSTRSLNGIPYVVEKVQWWGGAGAAAWTDGQVSIGAAAAGSRWLVADAQSGGELGHQTFAVIRNLGSTEEAVRVSVLGSGGLVTSQTLVVPAGTRVPVDPAAMPTLTAPVSGTYGVLVEALDGAGSLIVEHVTYWATGGAPWGAGVGAPATRLP